MGSAGEAELVFVVDVSSLTKKGFVGTTTYEGSKLDLEFDDGGTGVFLTAEMAGRLYVKKGSGLTIVMEDDETRVATSEVAGIGRGLRISEPKVYYAIGREGGAVLRIRKAEKARSPSSR